MLLSRYSRGTASAARAVGRLTHRSLGVCRSNVSQSPAATIGLDAFLDATNGQQPLEPEVELVSPADTATAVSINIEEAMAASSEESTDPLHLLSTEELAAIKPYVVSVHDAKRYHSVMMHLTPQPKVTTSEEAYNFDYTLWTLVSPRLTELAYKIVDCMFILPMKSSQARWTAHEVANEKHQKSAEKSKQTPSKKGVSSCRPLINRISSIPGMSESFCNPELISYMKKNHPERLIDYADKVSELLAELNRMSVFSPLPLETASFLFQTLLDADRITAAHRMAYLFPELVTSEILDRLTQSVVLMDEGSDPEPAVRFYCNMQVFRSVFKIAQKTLAYDEDIPSTRELQEKLTTLFNFQLTKPSTSYHLLLRLVHSGTHSVLPNNLLSDMFPISLDYLFSTMMLAMSSRPGNEAARAITALRSLLPLETVRGESSNDFIELMTSHSHVATATKLATKRYIFSATSLAKPPARLAIHDITLSRLLLSPTVHKRDILDTAGPNAFTSRTQMQRVLHDPNIRLNTDVVPIRMIHTQSDLNQLKNVLRYRTDMVSVPIISRIKNFSALKNFSKIRGAVNHLNLPLIATAYNGKPGCKRLEALFGTIVALDSEWCPDSSRLSTIQIAIPEMTFILDCHTLNKYQLSSFMDDLLSDPRLLKLGFSINDDLRVWGKSFNLTKPPVNVMDMQKNWTATTSLSKICEANIRGVMNKSMQISDWKSRPLHREQQQYAALDSYLLLVLFETITGFRVTLDGWRETIESKPELQRAVETIAQFQSPYNVAKFAKGPEQWSAVVKQIKDVL